jgi:hypothetical protein
MGLDTEDSDEDFFEVFMPSKSALLGLDSVKPSQHVKNDEVDIQCITLKRLVEGIVNGRVTDLEPLFCKREHIFIDFDIDRSKMLSRRLMRPLLGMVTHQRNLALKGNTDRYREDLGYDPKAACHCSRALWQAIRLKTAGVLKMYVDEDDERNRLMMVKRGELSKQEVLDDWDKAEAYLKRLNFPKSLPDDVDRDYWQNFLIRAQEYYLSLS